MTDSAGSTAAKEGTAGSGVWTWLLPALTFLAGAALSAGLFAIGDTDDTSLGEPDADQSSTPDPDASPSPDELVVQVPAVCVEAAELAGSVSAALGDVVDAAGALDARRLQESLDVVQQMRPEIESTSTACRELALDARIVTPEMTPEPTSSPSAAG